MNIQKILFKKIGWTYKPSGLYNWSISHAQVPFAYDMGNGLIRVYFSTRDRKGRSGVSFVEVSHEEPTKVLTVHDNLCLNHGDIGSFDESGAMPSWFLSVNDKIRMYYTGWNRSDTAAYRLAIGVAESTDGGITFQRLFKGPVLDRGINDQVWVAQPCILIENNIWKMWYLSCPKIEIVSGRPEPFYNVKYAESKNGILWDRKEITCIDFDEDTDAIGRPCVWKFRDLYYMLHSNRKADGYRTDSKSGYQICLSTSVNGLKWTKVKNFSIPKNTEWERTMNEYTSIVPSGRKGRYLVFYNGDGFGEAGFGVMELFI